MWYNGGMDTSDWLYISSIISGVIGTLTLGVIAWLNIRQVRNTHKAERKERLLNEIIEWVTDLNKCAWESEYTISTGVSSGEYKILREANIFSRFRAADSKSEYIRNIALTFGEDLHSNAEQVKKQLDELLALKWKSLLSEKDEEKQKLSEQIQHSEEKLYRVVEGLSRAAAQIKTKDIS